MPTNSAFSSSFKLFPSFILFFALHNDIDSYTRPPKLLPFQSTPKRNSKIYKMKLSTLISKFTLLVTAILPLTIQVVIATPTSEGTSITERVSDVPEHYNIVPLVVTGTIEGVAVNHTGTIQQVFAQLDAENNDFKLSGLGTRGVSDLPPRMAVSVFKHLSSYTPKANVMRQSYMTDVNCIPVRGQNWGRANQGSIREGINYLRRGSL